MCQHPLYYNLKYLSILVKLYGCSGLNRNQKGTAMLKHKHMIIRAEVSNPPQCEQTIVDWAGNLIRDIDMKIMMGPYAKYCEMPGNRGFTCVTIIETSHIAIHVWDEVKPALVQLDVYTCGELDKRKVFDALERWDPVKIEYKYLDREKELTLVDFHS